jgi:hypothetical protein
MAVQVEEEAALFSAEEWAEAARLVEAVAAALWEAAVVVRWVEEVAARISGISRRSP